MTGLSMRSRATLAAVAALAPVLVGASVAGVLVQRDQLTSSTTLVAREHAHAVAGQLAAGGSTGADAEGLGGEDLVQVVADGAVVAASPVLRGAEPLAVESSSRATVTRDLVDGEGDRYVVVTEDVPGTAELVVVARSLEAVDATAVSTTWLLVVGSILVVLTVGGLTWVLIGRALRPVDDMRREAAQITQANLAARLPDPGTGDEVERLATTLNALLDRLEHAVLTQRQFVADASHELRSPMAGLRAVLETSGLRPGLDPTGLEADTEDALRELARLEDLIADLLLLARSEATPPRRGRVDLAAVAATVAARPGRLPVTLTVPEHAWIEGDEHALSRVVRNLLDNAQRHARTSVRLAVEVGTDAERRAVGGVRLLVSDDGPGIPVADRERVFGRFVRLDEARARDEGGSGLGLAIVRQVVVDHGGSVTVVDALPGAVFVVDLPRPASDEAGEAGGDGATAAAHRPGAGVR